MKADTLWDLFLVLFVLVLIFPPAQAQDGDRPNVLLILADDMGSMDVSPYNPDAPSTSR